MRKVVNTVSFPGHRATKIFSYGMVGLVASIYLTGCVNEPKTSALKSAEITQKQTTHEERYVAKKCVSADRLRSSNTAGNALNSKLTELSSAQGLSEQARTTHTQALTTHAQTLQTLDENLKAQCISYSICEFQAGQTKQDCSTPKHKFLDAEKALTKLASTISSMKIR